MCVRILEVCEIRGGARCVPGVCLPGNRLPLSLVPPRLLRAQKRSRAATSASAADRAVHASSPGKWQEAERAECSKTSGNSERSKAGRRRVLAPAGRRMELSASLQVCAANMACWGAVLAEGSSVSALGGHRRRFLSAPLPGACVQVSELCATCSAGGESQFLFCSGAPPVTHHGGSSASVCCMTPAITPPLCTGASPQAPPRRFKGAAFQVCREIVSHAECRGGWEERERTYEYESSRAQGEMHE